ncbi:MAG: lysophospholipase [Planctomycetales bacterium]|nr:lysophospholipase [Planctomycetales bacterium]
MQQSTTKIVVGKNRWLFSRRWSPDQSPIGMVLIVHGLGEHSGRYANVARCLVEAGFGVAAVDLPGHGKSPGKRGYIADYDVLLQDLDKLRAQLDADLPQFVYGHSLGGNLVLNYALRWQPDVMGFVVTSPLVLPATVPPLWKRQVARLLNAVWPSFTFQTRVRPADLSHDLDAIRAQQEDPLVHNHVSARLALQMFQAGRYARAHAAKLARPMLLLHGSSDQITSHQASREFAEQAGPICELRINSGGFHELHWEADRAETLAGVVDWLKMHCVSDAPSRH